MLPHTSDSLAGCRSLLSDGELEECSLCGSRWSDACLSTIISSLPRYISPVPSADTFYWNPVKVQSDDALKEG